MNKFLLTLFGLGIAAATCAAPLTPEEALARIGQNRMATPASGLRLSHTFNGKTGSPAVYVFSRDRGEGFMLLSADDCAMPVLGYADDGNFDETSMPASFRWWLDEYARQIEWAATNEQGATVPNHRMTANRVAREPIEPMIQTAWDQVAPFNDQCPTYGADRTWTGCVATAMAQVMNYWKYPERGAGTVTFTSETLQKKLSLNFSLKAFDWDNMLDTYYPGSYNETEASAVAYLMKAAGYAVKSDYGLDATGALAMNIRQGLVKYFNYDGNAVYDMRIMHSPAVWEEKIYKNLKEVGPILYGGGSILGGGHSFVCDGYSTDGYFHFNWGWTGMCNGYFLLDALSPESLGSGGGNGGGYNFTQDAVFGIQPPTGMPVAEQTDRLTAMGSLVAEITDGRLDFQLDMQASPMWVNYNPTTMKVKLGAEFMNEMINCESECYAFNNNLYSIPAGYGIETASVKPSLRLADLGLEDGTYIVSLVSQQEGESVWRECRVPYGYYSSVILTKAGDKYTVKDCPAPSLDIKRGGFASEVYYGMAVKAWAEVYNPADIALTTGLAPLVAGQYSAEYIGESVMVTVNPKETKRVEWSTMLYPLQESFGPTEDKQMAMTFLDENSMLTYAGDLAVGFTMHPWPGEPTASIVGTPSIEGAKTTHTAGSMVRPSTTLYTVTDPLKMTVSAKVSVTEGVFAYPVSVCLCMASADHPGMVEILATAGQNMFIGAGETGDFEANLSYPLLSPDTDYTLAMAYESPNGLAVIPCKDILGLKFKQSGIADAIDDADCIFVEASGETVKAFSQNGNPVKLTLIDISGAQLRKGIGEVSVEGIHGLVIIQAEASDGTVRTLKKVL